MRSLRSVRLLMVACALGLLAAPAVASPIQYTFQSGSAQLDVGVAGVGNFSSSASLVGSSTTFDDMIPAITDVDWLIQDSVDLGIILGTLNVTVSIVDSAGFSSVASSTGAGTYDWSGGGFDVVATVSLTGGLIGDTGPIVVGGTIDSATGTVTIAGNTGTFTADKRHMFDIHHGGYTVTVEAALNFVGTAVPEPGTAVLLLSAALGWARIRRFSV